VFGVKESLITEFTEHPPGPAPEGRTMHEPWSRVTFDMVLAPAADQAS
jgi:hydroxyquinol 1,2-dioxygenase